MKLIRLFTSLVFLLINFIPLSVQSKPEVVDFPGKIDLVYYGKHQTELHNEPLTKVKVADKILYVMPDVIIPTVHGALFVEHTEILAGEDVLDIGTGCGIQGIFAAEKARKVVSTDISPVAVENAALNAKFHRVDHIVETRLGDLFEPIKKNEKFDVVLFNIDAPYNEETQGLWKVHERFFDNVNDYLKPYGRIYYQGGRVDNISHIQEMLKKNKLRIMKINMIVAREQRREPFVFLIQRDFRYNNIKE